MLSIIVPKGSSKLCLLFLIVLVLVASNSLAQFETHATVFVYHRFGDDRFPTTNISEQHFRAQLEILRQEDFTVITLGELVDLIEKGANFPKRCAVLTVDDAYRSFQEKALPLLREFGYPATLFVSTDSVGGDEFLDWEDLRLLQAAGIEIGNHSASHDYLLDRAPGETNQSWRSRIMADILKAQAAFSRNLGSTPKLFAYPYGEFSPELSEMIESLQFSAAVGQQSGAVSSDSDLFMMPRFPMGGTYSDPVEFRQKLFMKPLAVDILYPDSNIGNLENPPRLRVRLDPRQIDMQTLRCFVAGQPDGHLEKLEGTDDVFDVKAETALTGRRTKYTLTASDKTGQSWYWFSYLWVYPSL